MSKWSFWRDWLREERGLAAVLVAAGITGLFGMAAVSVDAGSLYMERQRLVNAADSAALAGVRYLPEDPGRAMQVAQEVAYRNGVPQGHAAATVVAGNTLKVVVDKDATLYFARVFGQQTQLVTAQARAQAQPISGVRGAAPFGVPRQQFRPGAQYTLKAGAGQGVSGNYYALALGGRGASNYRDNIVTGYAGTIRVGDVLTTEPGNKSGPTQQGIGERLRNAEESCTDVSLERRADAYNDLDDYGDGEEDLDEDEKECLESLPVHSKRVVIVPVVEADGLHGRDDVTVVGFAAFYLEDYDAGNNGAVYGRFINYLLQGETRQPAGDYGARRTRLLYQ